MGANFYGELIVRITSETSGLTKGVTQATATTEGMAKRMAAQTASVSKRMERLGLAMQNAGRTMTQFVTLPVAAGFAYATYQGYKYEQTLLKIHNLTGLTAEQTKAFGQEILALGSEVGIGPQNLAEALYFIASSGFKAQEAMGVLRVAAKASAAGLGDIMATADVATSAVNAYGHANLTAAHFVDVLMRTIEVGKAEPQQLAHSLGRIMPVAQGLGVSIEDLGGMIAGLTLTGLSSAEAVTALRGAMMALSAPTQMSLDAYKALGTSYKEVTKSIRERGLLPTLERLYQMVDGDRLKMRELIPNVRALNGVLSLLGPNYQRNLEVINAVNHAEGKLNDTFAATQQTASQKIRRALATIQSEFIKVGGILLPFAARLAEWVGTQMQLFDGLSESTKKSVLQFAALAALAGPLLMFFGGIIRSLGLLGTALSGTVTFIPHLVQGLGAVATAFRVAGTAAAASQFTVAFGPMGWIALGAAALAALAYGMYRLNKAMEGPKRSASEISTTMAAVTGANATVVREWSERNLGGHYESEQGELVWKPKVVVAPQVPSVGTAFRDKVEEWKKIADQRLTDLQSTAKLRVKDLMISVHEAEAGLFEMSQQMRGLSASQEHGAIAAADYNAQAASLNTRMEQQRLLIDALKTELTSATGAVSGFGTKWQQLSQKFEAKEALAHMKDVRAGIKDVEGQLRKLGTPTTVRAAMKDAALRQKLSQMRAELRRLTKENWTVVVRGKVEKAQARVDLLKAALKRIREGGVTRAEVALKDKITAKLATAQTKLDHLRTQQHQATVTLNDKVSGPLATARINWENLLAPPITQTVILKTTDDSSIPKPHSGGIFSGPHSGFPAILHGREAILPLDHPSLIPGIMARAGISYAGGAPVDTQAVRQAIPLAATADRTLVVNHYGDNYGIDDLYEMVRAASDEEDRMRENASMR